MFEKLFLKEKNGDNRFAFLYFVFARQFERFPVGQKILIQRKTLRVFHFFHCSFWRDKRLYYSFFSGQEKSVKNKNSGYFFVYCLRDKKIFQRLRLLTIKWKCAQQAHLRKPGRRAENEQRCMFQQQFRAEGTFLSDSNNNELLIINLANGYQQTEFYFPACVNAWPLAAIQLPIH